MMRLASGVLLMMMVGCGSGPKRSATAATTPTAVEPATPRAPTALDFFPADRRAVASIDFELMRHTPLFGGEGLFDPAAMARMEELCGMTPYDAIDRMWIGAGPRSGPGGALVVVLELAVDKARVHECLAAIGHANAEPLAIHDEGLLVSYRSGDDYATYAGWASDRMVVLTPTEPGSLAYLSALLAQKESVLTSGPLEPMLDRPSGQAAAWVVGRGAAGLTTGDTRPALYRAELWWNAGFDVRFHLAYATPAAAEEAATWLTTELEKQKKAAMPEGGNPTLESVVISRDGAVTTLSGRLEANQASVVVTFFQNTFGIYLK